VYVAWAKHAIYDDRNTGWNDVLAQLTNNAFRSQDWWYFPTAGESIGKLSHLSETRNTSQPREGTDR
jgi:hypothetical protein